MFSRTPELYDLIYGSFKDYAAEAALVVAVLQERAGHARTILDAACGTGEHLRNLYYDHGYDVCGLDIEPAFVDLARAKVPEGSFWCADMSHFDLGERFDVILCLFSSIAYLTDLDRVTSAFRCFRRHLNPGGLLLLEPWFEPEDWHPGSVYVHTANTDGLRVVRMSHSGVRGHTSTLEFHYLIGRADGVEYRREWHELGLFTREEMTRTLEAAGLSFVAYDPDGITDRGLYVATVTDTDLGNAGVDRTKREV